MGALVVSRRPAASSRADGGGERIVDDVELHASQPGEVLALIGESGSGKTTTALALMGYARRGCRITGGSVRIGDTDVLALDARGSCARCAAARVAYIAQSAAAVVQPVAHDHGPGGRARAASTALMPRAEAEAKAVALFRALALPDPETHRRSATRTRSPAASCSG